MAVVLVTIGGFLFMVINSYSIGGLILLMDILLVDIGGYYISGYWWLLY